MIHNEGVVDRGIRAVIAVAALVGALLIGIASVFGIILVVVAVIMAVTAAVGFCPLYRLFGVSTCRVAGTTSNATKTPSAMR